VEAPRRQLFPALRGERDRLAHAHALVEGDPGQADRARAPFTGGRGLQVLVYAPDQPGLFARITSFFERMQFDVAAAKIHTTQHGFALDTFQILPRTRGSGEHYRDLIQKVETKLAERIAAHAPVETAPTGRVSRWVKHFPVQPQVAVTPDRRPGRWRVEVSCADRPGLLSALARTLLAHDLNLVDARVTTLGARAEDAFVVSGEALNEPEARDAVAAEIQALAG
jgi:[protein-PII] uridylyltransferase